MSAARTPVLTGLADAVAEIADGAVVGIGGAVTSGHPMALVRALARRGVRDLTIVAPTAGIEVDLLIAAGCVATVVTSYVGIEGLAGIGPVFRSAAQEGSVRVRDLDEAHCVAGLRAAGQGLPFLPWRGGVGTSFPALTPELVEFVDPVRGEPLLAVPALALDVALIHVDAADEFGTALPSGTGDMDELVAAAARHVILQVDRVVPHEHVRREPARTWYRRSVAVVRAPFGTHPYSSATLVADADHLLGFVGAVRSGADGLRGYLERHVLGPASHEDYLETIGIRTIAELLV